MEIEKQQPDVFSLGDRFSRAEKLEILDRIAGYEVYLELADILVAAKKNRIEKISEDFELLDKSGNGVCLWFEFKIKQTDEEYLVMLPWFESSWANKSQGSSIEHLGAKVVRMSMTPKLRAHL